jgi:hypothetical protein
MRKPILVCPVTGFKAFVDVIAVAKSEVIVRSVSL